MPLKITPKICLKQTQCQERRTINKERRMILEWLYGRVTARVCGRPPCKERKLHLSVASSPRLLFQRQVYKLSFIAVQKCVLPSAAKLNPTTITTSNLLKYLQNARTQKSDRAAVETRARNTSLFFPSSQKALQAVEEEKKKNNTKA